MTWLLKKGTFSCTPNSTGWQLKLTSVRRVVKETDWPSIDAKAARIFKEKQPFDRLDVSKENLKNMFAYSKYKLHYINNLVEGESSTVYRCGTLVDLCRGPHIQNTGKIKTMKIMQVRTRSDYANCRTLTRV
jgi:threonyl-tRNA synthetase